MSKPNRARGPVLVAAGVVVDSAGRILIARRAAHRHQGGLWEFPGGKVEAGETVVEALTRELHEEVGIDVVRARPLIRFPYHYPDKSVLLDVWRVNDFSGAAHGREGQPVQWVEPEALREFAFPAANRPIVTAATLPSSYLITPEPGADRDAFLARLADCLAAGVRLVQLRAKQLDQRDYDALAARVSQMCRAHGARLLLNTRPERLGAAADGLHLSSAALARCQQRPVPDTVLLAASCHDAAELARARRIGVDFVVLSPVQSTPSHPDAKALGWEGFRCLTDGIDVPVFALGGLRLADRGTAFGYGAQGVAGIRAFWAARDLASELQDGP